MRLGLIGPAEGDLAALARAAEHLLNGARVHRAIYLGGDQALEETVARWAEALVGSDPSDDGMWGRAMEVAMLGGSEEIDGFLRAERGRQRLKALESLPRGGTRSVELFDDRVAVLIHDKGMLDEEDIFSATFLIYGKSDGPLAKKIGPRWFVTPGKGGTCVLDDSGEDVVATFYDAEGKPSQTETLSVARGVRMRVQGDT
jgi:hypothetical protein